MALTRTFMQLRPIIAALGRHKVATLLIVLQVALTLAVASNALFIVATRIVHLSRPTSTDEAHLFVIRNGWKMGQTAGQIDANIRADLECPAPCRRRARRISPARVFRWADTTPTSSCTEAQAGPEDTRATGHVLRFGRAHDQYAGYIAGRRAQFSSR
jgi:hypothetical protein